MTFRDWLHEYQAKKPRTAKDYASTIANKLSGLATVVKSAPKKHLSSINSNKKFEKFCATHDSSGKIFGENTAGKDFYRRALVCYAEYLLYMGGAKPLTTLDNKFLDAVKKSLSDSKTKRNARLKKASTTPETTTTIVVTYKRNPDVVAAVLAEAKGCADCKTYVPFPRKSDGTPYYEVHHVIPLSAGGKDEVANAVALCPTCHRRRHYG